MLTKRTAFALCLNNRGFPASLEARKIYETLPTKPYFSRFALAAYRALLQTQGIDCVKLLPQILRAVDPVHEKERVSFGYLLSITIQRFDQEVFLNKATEALDSAGHDVAEVCSNVLRLEDFLEDAFKPSQEEQLRRCVKHLRRAILDPATHRLYRMEGAEKAEALNLLLERKQPEKVFYSSLDTPMWVFVYPRKYEIKVSSQVAASLQATLDEYQWDSPFGNSPNASIIVGRPPDERALAVGAAAAATAYLDDKGE